MFRKRVGHCASGTGLHQGVFLACILLTASASATDYHVGPGQPLVAIGEVPWATLVAGDTVLIHWRSEPYREKWVVNRRGTEADPIRIVGVPGPLGERPVIDGNGATTVPGVDFWNESRGVVKIGGSNVPPDGLPGHLVVESLEIRSGRPPYTFTDDGGFTQTYAGNAASIYVEKAEFLTLRDCVLHDSANGLFVGAFDGETQHLLIEGNHLYDNGIEGSGFEHNAYTAAIDITYQFNRFGALRGNAGGNNLKDRSAGLVVRYNWIEDGNRQLDLVDAEDSQVLVQHPSYGETFVYGNVLIESDGEGNSQIAHYGGDSGTTADYRKGTLYFFQNTVVSTRTGNTTLLRLSTQDETADVRDNILFVAADGDRLALIDDTGTLELHRNWLKPGWRISHGSASGTVVDAGDSIEGETPGFLDAASQDFALADGSPVIDEAVSPHPGTLPDHATTGEYVLHQQGRARPLQGPLDLGAFEHCPAAGCSLIFTDGFESGDLTGWGASLP